MTNRAFTIGLDYGTNSVRALVVDCATGEAVGAGVFDYPSGEQGILLDPRDPHLARQHPGDYLEGLRVAVARAFDEAAAAPGFSRDRVIGIGVDTTGSTPMPVDAQNRPLASIRAGATSWRRKPGSGRTTRRLPRRPRSRPPRASTPRSCWSRSAGRTRRSGSGRRSGAACASHPTCSSPRRAGWSSATSCPPCSRASTTRAGSCDASAPQVTRRSTPKPGAACRPGRSSPGLIRAWPTYETASTSGPTPPTARRAALHERGRRRSASARAFPSPWAASMRTTARSGRACGAGRS